MRQIFYLSTEAWQMSDEELHALRSESLANNALHGVTGLLLHVDRVFLQVIEGPSVPIGQLFANIRNDRRIKDVVEMFDRPVESRAFPVWAMGFQDPDANASTGFYNIRNRDAFEAIERNDQTLFSMMRELYAANAGRGF